MIKNDLLAYLKKLKKFKELENVPKKIEKIKSTSEAVYCSDLLLSAQSYVNCRANYGNISFQISNFKFQLAN